MRRISSSHGDLVRDDPYGVRDRLLDLASSFLPAEVLRKLAEQFWDDAEAARASEPPAIGNDRFSFLRPGSQEFLLVGDVARQYATDMSARKTR